MAVTVRLEAQDDLAAAARWYETQEKGLGKSFLAEVRDTLVRIDANPGAYPEVYRNARRALIRRFPYGVIYLPIPDLEAVMVVAVLHCGQNPRLWKERAKADPSPTDPASAADRPRR